MRATTGLMLGWMGAVGCAEDGPAEGKDPVETSETTPSPTTTDLPTTSTPTPTTSTETEIDPAVAAAEAMYDPDHVAEIAFTIDVADAELLSAETNSLFSLLEGEDCLDSPWSGPFNWYPADVVVDGVRRDQVGVRKKGLIGSLSTEKPSLKVDFDKFVDGQTLDGLERLTLNNSISDPSLIKQCLGYQLFRDAGLAAPRCHFAHVSANGDDLGVYVSVEPLKKDFLRWAFDGDEDGDLYEGTLSDFRAGWTSTFEADTNSTDPTRAPILAVEAALALEDDAAMLAALDAVVDMDGFYRFWAMEVIVGHLDGYTGNTNNFYVYRPENSDKLVFIPWGIDAIFLRFESFGSDTSLVALNNTALTRRLWSIPDQRQRYLDTLQEMLDTVWDEDALLAEVDRMEALTAPLALPDDGWREAELVNVREFITTRQAELEAAIAAPMPEYDIPLREGICLVESGTLRVDFDTAWGSLQVPDPLGEGVSLVVGQADGVDFDAAGGAIAGEEYGMATIAGLVLTTPTDLLYGVVQVPLPWVEEGARIPLDGMSTVALLAGIDFRVSEDAFIVGSIWSGELVIDSFTGVPGEPIVGHFEGTLYSGGPY